MSGQKMKPLCSMPICVQDSFTIIDGKMLSSFFVAA